MGGSAADHSGVLTMSNALLGAFNGIYLNVGSSVASSIQNIPWQRLLSQLHIQDLGTVFILMVLVMLILVLSPAMSWGNDRKWVCCTH